MMVQALLPGCSTTQEATNQSEASRSNEPPVMSELSRQYVAPASPIPSSKLRHACTGCFHTGWPPVPAAMQHTTTNHPSNHMPMLRLHEVKHPFGLV